MASKSFRRKRDSRTTVELYQEFLQDGAIFRQPPPELGAAARSLETHGVVTVQRLEYVHCSNERDRDFPPRVRGCRGQIYLDEGLDENGNEYRCPECDRPVFPHRHQKQRKLEIRANVRPDGVAECIENALTAAGYRPRRASVGVWHVEKGSERLWVCVVDFCEEQRYLARDWARAQPTCYIVVDPITAEERFHNEAWLCRLTLAAILVDPQALRNALKRLGTPSHVGNVSVPVVTKSVAPIRLERETRRVEPREYLVEFRPDSVVINGVEVIGSRATEQHEIFGKLLKRFTEDLAEALTPTEYRTLRIADLTNTDVEVPRRTINRLQASIADALRRQSGYTVDSQDVVESCGQPGKRDLPHGYRLNPRCVCVRPIRTGQDD